MLNYVKEDYDGSDMFGGKTTSMLARKCGIWELEQEGEEDQGSDGQTAWRKTCRRKVFNQGMQRRGWSEEERFAPATLTRSGIKPEEEEEDVATICDAITCNM